MYFTSVTRFSPEHGRTLPYYKIKESFRDVLGRVHTRVMLTPGYLPDLCCDEIVQIRRGLTVVRVHHRARAERRQTQLRHRAVRIILSFVIRG